MLAASAALLAVSAVQAANPGERLFQQCYACHSVDPAERGLPGPNLSGVVGRPAAGEPGFDYSAAMRSAAARGLRWSEAELDRFIADPEAAMPGTSMSYLGLRKAEERRALIDYLKRASR